MISRKYHEWTEEEADEFIATGDINIPAMLIKSLFCWECDNAIDEDDRGYITPEYEAYCKDCWRTMEKDKRGY